MTTSPWLARRLAAWGLPARVGDVVNAFDVDVLRTGEVAGSAGGAGVRMSSVVPAGLRETTPEHLRLFGVSGGRLIGAVDFIEDEHTHLMAGRATVTAVTGSPTFPAPEEDGVAIQVEAGYGLRFQRVARS